MSENEEMIIGAEKKEEPQADPFAVCCNNCTFFSPIKSMNLEEPKQGACRRYPPKAFPVPTTMGGIQSMSILPSVLELSFCGEHQFRDEA